MFDWKRKQTGVAWGDLLPWFAELRDRYGLWGLVQFQPPLPSRERTTMGVVVVELTRHLDGNRVEKLTRWRAVPHSAKVDPIAVAFQLLTEIVARLDTEAWEAERDAAVQGRLF